MKDFALRVINAKPGETHLFWAGQAGYIVKSKSGQLFGIDLYLSDCVERIEGSIGFKRLLPKAFECDALTFDCIVSTHPHVDHFDVDIMAALMDNSKTRLYASVECEKEVDRLAIEKDRASFVKPGDSFCDGDFTLDFINCDHGTGAPDAVGLILTVDGKRILTVGDTCLRLDRVSEYVSKGKIDVMIAPINGAYGNLNEKDCALLIDAVKPSLAIPSHYGMFAAHGGNIGLFYKIMTEQYPHNAFNMMRLGEGIIL